MNDSGFTYIEALISLSIAAFVMSLTPSILMQFENVHSPAVDFEVDFFMIDIAEAYEKSSEVRLDARTHSVVFTTGKGEVEYRKHGSRIIKSVEQNGYVTVMFGADDFKIEETAAHVHISVSGKGEGNDETAAFAK
ncbi:hypothetical protein GQ671_02665 [Salinicoccus hispanicus]|uniref:Prepilin-type N-terminal cleavage/methylation domain-containing protein n=1 Tax=Salinicoccus hispanicus TaxID=157225 RepID=A0A6N8U1E2_9STAP|nr:competence type IV pilus minor pilin ComGF [Salinicoccus hispanicus]MXQ50205.1 hypothetical protein [Salinicoccus hispanicus]